MNSRTLISAVIIFVLSNVLMPLRSVAQEHVSGQTLKIDGATYVYHDYLGKYYELTIDSNEPSYNQDADVHRFLMDNREQHHSEEDVVMEFNEGVQLRITANIPEGLDQKVLKCFSKKEIRLMQANKCNIRFYAKVESDLKPKSFFLIKTFGTDQALSSKTLNKLVELLKKELTYNDRGTMAKYNFKYFYNNYFPVVIEFDGGNECRVVNYDS